MKNKNRLPDCILFPIIGVLIAFLIVFYWFYIRFLATNMVVTLLLLGVMLFVAVGVAIHANLKNDRWK